MKKNSSALVIYDPDFGNPYGRELAVLLSQNYSVKYAGASSSGWHPHGLARLAGHKFAKDGHTKGSVIVAYVLVILSVFFRTLRGDTLIVVWCRTSLDRYLFGLLSSLSGRVIYIVHNPKARKSESTFARHAESFLRQKSEIVVHSEKLRPLLSNAGLKERVHIIPHPPYMAYAAHYSSSPSRIDNSPRILFLGQLRSDKSPEDMASFLAAFPRGGGERIVFCGRGKLTAELKAAAVGLSLVDKMDVDGVADDVLCTEVAAADVLVAPYREVTQSGSIILALSFGVPVVSYRAGAVGDIVDTNCLAPVGDVAQLLRLVSNVLSGSSMPHLVDIEKWRDRSLDGWKRMLEYS